MEFREKKEPTVYYANDVDIGTEWNLEHFQAEDGKWNTKVDIGTEWNLEICCGCCACTCICVDIGTEWNLESYQYQTFQYNALVDIGTEWNLEVNSSLSFLQSHQGRYRNRVEFRDFLCLYTS